MRFSSTAFCRSAMPLASAQATKWRGGRSRLAMVGSA
jgi:hypothetical protein